MTKVRRSDGPTSRPAGGSQTIHMRRLPWAAAALQYVALAADVASEADAPWDPSDGACKVDALPAYDGGPWPCSEAGCPAPLVTCEMLEEYCASTFSDVWERPPHGLAGVEISMHCQKTCGTVGANSSSIDEAIGLRYIHGLISPAEAAQLVGFCDAAPQRWRPSRTRARQADRDDVEERPGRTSESCALVFAQFYQKSRHLVAARSPSSLPELDLTWSLTRRFAHLLDVDVRRIEPLQIVRYATGSEYVTHHDHTGWYKDVGGGETAATAEKRALTLLLFLSAPEEGGHLRFPELAPPVSIRPRAADGVVWSNLDADGQPSRLALHAGLPPTAGQKVVANVWVAEEPFLQMPKGLGAR